MRTMKESSGGTVGGWDGESFVNSKRSFGNSSFFLKITFDKKRISIVGSCPPSVTYALIHIVCCLVGDF